MAPRGEANVRIGPLAGSELDAFSSREPVSTLLEKTVALPGRTWMRRRGGAGEQPRENAGQKNAIEGPGPPNRGPRGAKPADLVEVHQVGANERSHRAADIGQRRRVF